ncbi:MAG TPA: nuclear transport factor 2 family protein [Acidimicrobiia bacterium]
MDPKEKLMDIVDQHFAAENAQDVAATLATYTDDIVWDDVTHPLSPVRGKEAVGAVYSDIIDAIPDVNFVSVRRFKSDDGWVVDESNVTGHVHGQWAGIDGGGAPVEIRILHLFHLRDGLIEYENTWFDSAAIARQVEAWKNSNA